ncbi:MAG: aldehyde ferredoxin oxidoreductase family protein [Planctomycetes bacterium]|nr:aldehyde ferredoxin oxidoreductase family protein [Planctomycetota bacterium]
MNGYMGKLLRVNLTNRTTKMEGLNPQMARDYIGGTGLGVRMAYDEIPPKCDPLGPENKVFILTGPLTATNYPTAGRYQVICKSPATGILCDASSGGHWAAYMKRTGYDGLVIEGASDKPVYLWMTDDKVEIRDAADLWGKDCFATQEELQKRHGGKDVYVACIGPAGERGAMMACLINDDGRAPGRGGNGAVLGAKKLKAIAVKGTKAFPLAKEAELKEECRKIPQREKAAGWDLLTPYGTAQVLDNSQLTGDIPVKNWQLGEWKDGHTKLGGKHMADTILTKRPACYRCPIACARWVHVKEGPYAFEGPGPEYETLGSLGSMTLVDDLNAVSYAGHLCNVYGMDTISAGTTIAFAFECFEKGLLTLADTDGIELRWGSADALVKATEKLGKVDGFGKLLALGMKRLAEKLGRGAIDFACQVKGLESPMHDPRAYFSLAATYAASPRGSCHLHGASMCFEFDNSLPEWGLKELPKDPNKGRGKVAQVSLAHAEVFNSAVLCYFLPFYYNVRPAELAHHLNLATGASYTSDELLTIGNRISTLHRAYNIRCGLTAADDKLSPRQLQKTNEGGNKDKSPDVKAILAEYYKCFGWSRDGVPTKATLKKLGLSFVVKDLYPS